MDHEVAHAMRVLRRHGKLTEIEVWVVTMLWIGASSTNSEANVYINKKDAIDNLVEYFKTLKREWMGVVLSDFSSQLNFIFDNCIKELAKNDKECLEAYNNLCPETPVFLEKVNMGEKIK